MKTIFSKMSQQQWKGTSTTPPPPHTHSLPCSTVHGFTADSWTSLWKSTLQCTALQRIAERLVHTCSLLKLKTTPCSLRGEGTRRGQITPCGCYEITPTSQPPWKGPRLYLDKHCCSEDFISSLRCFYSDKANQVTLPKWKELHKT